MTRIFIASQPGVLAMTHIVPDLPTDEEFQLYWDYLSQNYYRVRTGKGWVLYRPSVLPSDVRHAVNSAPAAR